MKQRWIRLLIVVLVLSFFGSLPAVVIKERALKESDTVGFSIDARSAWKENASFLLKEAKERGVTYVGIPPNTLRLMKDTGEVEVTEAGGAFRITPTLPAEKDELDRIIRIRFGDQSREVGDSLEISVPWPEAKDEPLHYTDHQIEAFKQYNLPLMIRIHEAWPHEKEALEMLGEAKEKGLPVAFLSFDGDVPGVPSLVFLEKAGLPVSLREDMFGTDPQRGVKTYGLENPAMVTRAYHIANRILGKYWDSPDILAGRIALATSDRTLRLVTLEVPKNTTPTSEEYWGALTLFQEAVKKEGFEIGEPEPLRSSHSLWRSLSIGSAYVFALSILGIIGFFIRPVLSPVFLGAGALFLFMVHSTGWSLGEALFPLLFAVLIPVMVVHVVYERASRQHPFLLFLSVSLFTILSATVLYSMHSDMVYALYLKQFRGVLAMHAIPVLASFMYVAWRQREGLKTLTWASFKWYHGFLVLLVMTAGAYYLMRTGNNGFVLDIERDIRAYLEETLPARPRTKEFLIGHPLLILVLCFWRQSRLMKWLLPIAIIGQVSMVNTMTHFHTPYEISLLRSLLGLAFGVLLGIMAWVVVKGFLVLVRSKKEKDSKTCS
ncbi:hypothetical protein IMZ31_19465 (plasmid) [Pontibacillus sp. ALD_SL1]|uniref:DUF5693 family protein n=1 Tax=Pontibacillus sp. ALD_SL1 TaxID=2777185 RepID=UPI001A978669|nr:DUF5693 family protein [Pontibacillus sp. ALD_SL1]QST02730.1 hypothetical protein IMZ31_19465 [Pontibacillus sp. ALD_SL1]